MDPLREGGREWEWVRKGGVRVENTGYYKILFLLYLLWKVFKSSTTIFFKSIHTAIMLFLTCPEGGCLPVMVVMGEASEARHAASVVVLEPLEEFT